MLENVKRTWVKGLAVSLAIAGLFVFAGCGNKQAQQQKTGAVAVKSMQVIKRDTPNLYEFTGFVEAQQEANITARSPAKILTAGTGWKPGRCFSASISVRIGQTY